MRIFIENLCFETIIGILPFEREEAQSIRIDLWIDYEGAYIDYGEVRGLIIEQMQKREFELLEAAITFFAKDFETRYPNMRHLWIKITKTAIFDDCDVGVEKGFDFPR